jgi:16S rRNA (guanine527-N7)-methyltransferase
MTMSGGGPDRPLWFRTECRKNGLRISDAQLDLLQGYVRELLRWNSRINLISRREEELVWERHILHCVAPLFQIVLPAKKRYLDLGTGGGLPGIPLKILMPESEWVLLDATRKKVDAVNEIIDALGLQGITGIWGRGEELGKRDGLKHSFDVVVARGVSQLDALVKLSRPFLREPLSGLRREGEQTMPTPVLLAWKGGDLGEEIRRARRQRAVQEIREVGLRLSGAEEGGRTDKKIVTVTFRLAEEPTAAEGGVPET